MPIIKLYANLRTVTGKKELTIPGADLGAILEKLIRDYPGLERFLFDNGKLRPRVVLTLNGQTLDIAAYKGVTVKEHDHIAIFPPVAGG